MSESDGLSTETSKTEAAKSKTTINTSDMFTDNDMEIGYDEETSAKITLSADSAAADSNAVKISGSTVTITDEGTYILSGTLNDGMIVVDAEDTDKVHLILKGVQIKNSTSAAIYVTEADKVFITTAADSENTLANGGEYVAIDDNNIDAVVFSKSDLTLNGSGKLTIDAAAGHGVVSKDDLVLTSGTYDITAANHGLSGKDSIRITNGTYTITSGKDGMHAENKDDTSQGFIYIAGGTFQVKSEDDAIHSETGVAIQDGEFTIAYCYEGIEGETVTIDGGTFDITAADDGINAAGGADNSGFGGRRSGGEDNSGFGGGRPREDQFPFSSDSSITINGGTYANNGGDVTTNDGSESNPGQMGRPGGKEDQKTGKSV